MKGNTCVAAIYRQHDGYLDEHGATLKKHFGGTRVINGIQGEEMGTHANGMGCLAAQIVEKLKNKIGGIYLHEVPDEDAKRHTDFVYTVRATTKDVYGVPVGTLHVDVQIFGRPVYSGPLSKLPGDAELDEDQ